MTTGTRSRLWNAGIDFDKGDPWGSSMAAHFGIAHALEHAGEDVPGEWEYRDSPLCDGLDPDEDYEAIAITEAIERGDLTWAEVVRIGAVLHRYEAILDRAGRSY